VGGLGRGTDADEGADGAGKLTSQRRWAKGGEGGYRLLDGGGLGNGRGEREASGGERQGGKDRLRRGSCCRGSESVSPIFFLYSVDRQRRAYSCSFNPPTSRSSLRLRLPSKALG
jgi:hypothetical protein